MVPARRTLGDGVQVEVWYLAQHFLLSWIDWSGLLDRYVGYFGQDEEVFPRTWATLDANCRSLAGQLRHDRQLGSLIRDDWYIPVAVNRLAGEPEPSVQSVYHEMVTNHRRLTLLGALQSLNGDESKYASVDMPDGRVWLDASETAQQLNTDLLKGWVVLSIHFRDSVLWHLRHYQRATLLASWLAPETGKDGANESALMTVLRKEQPVIPTIEQFSNQVSVEPRDRDLLRRVLERIQTAVADFSYANFVEDITSADFFPGDASAVGSNAINLIPGNRDDDCRTILLAVSRGDKRAIGFPAVMRQVREHLIRCSDKTRAVIILCDHWSPPMLDEHLADLRAHYSRGVRFLFLMAGTPGRILAPVGVDLNLSP